MYFFLLYSVAYAVYFSLFTAYYLFHILMYYNYNMRSLLWFLIVLSRLLKFYSLFIPSDPFVPINKLPLTVPNLNHDEVYIRLYRIELIKH